MYITFVTRRDHVERITDPEQQAANTHGEALQSGAYPEH
jgi:hypothetical protein